MRRLICEQLEMRLALAGMVATPLEIEAMPDADAFHAVIVAGVSPDSPTKRVDSNSDNTPLDGVGSLTIATRRGNYICTGTPVDATRVITAGHCVDINGDGKSDSKDGITSITFNLNYGGTYTSQIRASKWVTHPNYTGFNKPSVNDDIAILTLGSPIPTEVPRYGLFTGSLAGQTITLVGYGQSGDGINGYTVNASYTVKRVGQNVVDAFYAQDDSLQPAANEVFRFDFDRADGTNGPLGGPSLGNLTETTLGGGDSGGPSFVFDGTNYLLAGVNTFSQSNGTISAPKFGSMGGGMSIPAYTTWINSVLSGTTLATGTASGVGRNTAGTASIHVIRGEVEDLGSAPFIPPVESLVLSRASGRFEESPVQSEDGNTGLSVEHSMASQLLVAVQTTHSSKPATLRRLDVTGTSTKLAPGSDLERLAAVDAFHGEHFAVPE